MFSCLVNRGLGRHIFMGKESINSLRRMRDLFLDSLDSFLKRVADWKEKEEKGEVDYTGSNYARLPLPYFIALNLRDESFYILEAADGAVYDSRPGHERTVRMEVRVGNYDNDGVGSDASALTEDKYHLNSAKRIKTSIERALWHLFENSLDKAINDCREKEGMSAVEYQYKEKLPDFAKLEEIVNDVEEPQQFKINTQKWDSKFRKLSAKLSEPKYVVVSEVSLEAEKVSEYILTTEGTKIFQENVYARLLITASARGVEIINGEEKDDGTTVETFRVYFFRDLKSLSNYEKKIEKDIESVIKELDELRKAEKITEVINAPAILEQEATDVYIHEAFEAHRLNPSRVGCKEMEEGSFLGMVGEQILPLFLDAYSDPTQLEFKGKGLNGYYKYDFEGVRAQRVDFIKAGKLENFLLSRTPIRDLKGKIFYGSNGHARLESLINEEENEAFDPRPRKSNFFLKSNEPVSYEELKRGLKKEIRNSGSEFGLIICGVTSGDTITEEHQICRINPGLIYRFDPKTNKKTLIRGAYINQTPLSPKENIIATDNCYKVSNGKCGEESGIIYQGSVVPRILVRRIELYPINERNAPYRLPKPY